MNINSESELSYILRGYNEIDQEKQIDFLCVAIITNPDSWISNYLLGNIYYSQKNYYTAIKYYSDFLEIVSKLKIESDFIPAVYFNLGYINDILKNYSASESAYRSCIRLSPDFDYANNNLGYCLFKQKKYEESLKIFNSCIKKTIDGEYPIFNKIRVLKKLGEYDGALDFIEKYENSVKGKKTLNKLKNDILKTKDKQNKGIMDDEMSEPEIDSDFLNASINNDQDIQKNENKIDPFSTERELEFLLEQRIRKGDKVLGRKLKMFNDYGRQYSTPIGRIDLLTIDEESDEIIIIELKKGESEDDVFGQISRYIGFIKEKLAKPDQHVKGIIYVYSATDKLKYAAKYSNDVIIHEYNIMKY